MSDNGMLALFILMIIGGFIFYISAPDKYQTDALPANQKKRVKVNDARLDDFAKRLTLVDQEGLIQAVSSFLVQLDFEKDTYPNINKYFTEDLLQYEDEAVTFCNFLDQKITDIQLSGIAHKAVPYLLALYILRGSLESKYNEETIRTWHEIKNKIEKIGGAEIKEIANSFSIISTISKPMAVYYIRAALEFSPDCLVSNTKFYNYDMWLAIFKDELSILNASVLPFLEFIDDTPLKMAYKNNEKPRDIAKIWSEGFDLSKMQ